MRASSWGGQWPRVMFEKSLPAKERWARLYTFKDELDDKIEDTHETEAGAGVVEELELSARKWRKPKPEVREEWVSTTRANWTRPRENKPTEEAKETTEAKTSTETGEKTGTEAANQDQKEKPDAEMQQPEEGERQEPKDKRPKTTDPEGKVSN